MTAGMLATVAATRNAIGYAAVGAVQQASGGGGLQCVHLLPAMPGRRAGAPYPVVPYPVVLAPPSSCERPDGADPAGDAASWAAEQQEVEEDEEEGDAASWLGAGEGGGEGWPIRGTTYLAIIRPSAGGGGASGGGAECARVQHLAAFLRVRWSLELEHPLWDAPFGTHLWDAPIVGCHCSSMTARLLCLSYCLPYCLSYCLPVCRCSTPRTRSVASAIVRTRWSRSEPVPASWRCATSPRWSRPPAPTPPPPPPPCRPPRRRRHRTPAGFRPQTSRRRRRRQALPVATTPSAPGSRLSARFLRTTRPRPGQPSRRRSTGPS